LIFLQSFSFWVYFKRLQFTFDLFLVARNVAIFPHGFDPSSTTNLPDPQLTVSPEQLYTIPE